MKSWILGIKQSHKSRKKQKEKDILKNLRALFKGRERILDPFESKISPVKNKGTDFSDKVSNHSKLIILTPKQMLLRLPIALAQVKSCNNSNVY